MTGEWRGQNLQKTVGECEIEVGRHKHMHEMRQCSSVLLGVGGGGTDATVPQWCLPLPVVRLVVCLRSFSSLPLLLLLFFSLCLSPLSVSLFRVARGQRCLARSLVDVSLWTLCVSAAESEHSHAHSFSLARTVSRCPSILGLSSPHLPPSFSFSLMRSLSLSFSLTCSTTHRADTVRG